MGFDPTIKKLLSVALLKHEFLVLSPISYNIIKYYSVALIHHHLEVIGFEPRIQKSYA